MDDLTNQKKRLKIQSWRRGMKEMDLILGKFIDKNLDTLTHDEIANYERLLLQDDQLIFSWFCKYEKIPVEFISVVAKISDSIEQIK
jgi:antitoxin CptB